MNRGKPRRLIYWLAAPLVLGICAGLITSKLLWNYFWAQPTVAIDEGAVPTAIAIFHREPTVRVLSESDRNAVLQREFRECLEHGEDCTFGRVLAATGTRWLAVPILREEEIRSTLGSLTTSPAPFLQENQTGVGLIATYVVNGEPRTLVAFQTLELQHDTHGYVEVLARGSGAASQPIEYVHYFFDVAGIEFATPRVLVVVGMVLAYVTAALLFIGTKVVAVVNRRRLSGHWISSNSAS